MTGPARSSSRASDARGSANAYVLLAVLGVGVFLSGLELMIMAVALPSIVGDLGGWTELRRASWVINGYLLVFIVTMPLAGRLADLWGTARLFLAALVVFTVGAALAGRAQTLDELIAARLVQAAGGGALVPVATAAASHLFDGHARPRALGVIGALTFLGMAAGPFVGAAILDAIHPAAALSRFGIDRGPLMAAFGSAWRFVFYVNVPIGIVALALGWAAWAGWDTPRRPTRIDLAGAVAFSAGLAGVLVGLTLAGSSRGVAGGIDAGVAVGVLVAGGLIVAVAAVLAGAGRRDPFVDPRLFRLRPFSSAALVSLLTGYGFATAIIGGAVFVDRVLYGGPDSQRLTLGALAGATAVGALVSGFAVRRLGLRSVTVVGLALSAAALVAMSAWSPATSMEGVAGSLAAFGFGFGLTVTPRSTAAVEAVGREAFGVASATVTVARMIGMAVGLAVLAAYGSTTIDRLAAQINPATDTWRSFVPAELRDRPFRDGLVVQALERYLSGEAARILVGIFLVAAALTVVAFVPALALSRPAKAGARARPDATRAEVAQSEDEPQPSIAL
ncbi:MAG TPA: MFS transporter [Candidatus Limnocylindrales bacterium]